MRKLTDAEIQQISGSGSTTYRLPLGTTLTTALMPNGSTTITGQYNGQTVFSWNSGQYLAKTFISTGVGGMAVAFTGGSLLLAGGIGMAAGYGAGLLMNSGGGGG